MGSGIAGWVLLPFLSVLAMSAQAQSGLTEKNLEQHAHQFLLANLPEPTADLERTVSITALPHLELAPCPLSAVSMEIPDRRAQGKFSIRVRCQQADGSDAQWALVLPVQVTLHTQVLVSHSPLPRNHVLTTTDIQWQRVDVSRLRGSYFTDTQALLGMETRRALRAGTLISSSMVQPPQLIARHQPVNLRSDAGKVSVSIRGVALQDGRLGERIRVRNEASGMVVHGWVASSHEVTTRPLSPRQQGL